MNPKQVLTLKGLLNRASIIMRERMKEPQTLESKLQLIRAEKAFKEAARQAILMGFELEAL